MNELLETLACLPGVRFVALVTEDGVPVAVPGRKRGIDLLNNKGSSNLDVDEVDGCAAVSVGWLDEVTRLVAALSWESPHRVTLRAARGTMVLLRTSGAVLVAVLEAGLEPEELKLSMDGVAARIQRVLRGMNSDPPAPLPVKEGGLSVQGAGSSSSSSRREPNQRR